MMVGHGLKIIGDPGINEHVNRIGRISCHTPVPRLTAIDQIGEQFAYSDLINERV